MSQRQKQPRQWHLRAGRAEADDDSCAYSEKHLLEAGLWSAGMRSGCRQRWLLLLLCRAGVSLVTLLASSQVPKPSQPCSRNARASRITQPWGAPIVAAWDGYSKSWLRREPSSATANRRSSFSPCKSQNRWRRGGG
jgi:hypothetical protein